MAISNPVNAQRIVDRFKQLVTDVANAGIVAGTDALPTYSGVIVVDASQFGGTTSGRTIDATGATITPATNRVTAENIVSALVAETNRYTRIRQVRAKLNVTGGGGNKPAAGSVLGAPKGIVYDETGIAHMSDANKAANITAPNPATNNIQTGSVIDDVNLENYFTALKDAYVVSRLSVLELTKDVCHSSCHSSCHGSRSRR